MDKDIKNLIVDSFSTLAVLTANTQAQLGLVLSVIWSQSEQRSTIYSVSDTTAIVNLAVNIFNIATVRTITKV